MIEDYAPIRESVVCCLRDLGFIVAEAADGEEGLWLALQESYEVIVLDVMLPIVDGLEVLRRLRELGSDSLILILTARDELGDRLRGLDGGADDYSGKPFALAELASRVKALIRRKHGYSRPTIRAGAVRIDLNTRKVWLGESELRMTAREYSILELLALKRGQILTRQEIWEAVLVLGGRMTVKSNQGGEFQIELELENLADGHELVRPGINSI